MFQLNDNDYGETNNTEHIIDTGNAKPLKQRQYRLPKIAKEEITKQVTTMKKAGQIEESNSPWCNPILIVPKKSEILTNPDSVFASIFETLTKSRSKIRIRYLESMTF